MNSKILTAALGIACIGLPLASAGKDPAALAPAPTTSWRMPEWMHVSSWQVPAWTHSVDKQDIAMALGGLSILAGLAFLKWLTTPRVVSPLQQPSMNKHKMEELTAKMLNESTAPNTNSVIWEKESIDLYPGEDVKIVAWYLQDPITAAELVYATEHTPEETLAKKISQSLAPRKWHIRDIQKFNNNSTSNKLRVECATFSKNSADVITLKRKTLEQRWQPT